MIPNRMIQCKSSVSHDKIHAARTLQEVTFEFSARASRNATGVADYLTCMQPAKKPVQKVYCIVAYYCSISQSSSADGSMVVQADVAQLSRCQPASR